MFSRVLFSFRKGHQGCHVFAKKGAIAVKSKFPHTYVLLFSVIILCALLTYIIPAGVYERVKDPNTGRTVVDAASFHHVEPTPTHPFDVFLAVQKGMKQAGGIIFFIFLVGGAFSVIQATGFVEAGIGKILGKIQGKETLLIPLTMFLFSLGGATFGMAEETIVFIPIGVAIARAMGYDSITGMAMVSLGAAAGFTGGWMNPFTVGVAQGIAELPIFSGIAFRLGVYVVVLFIAMAYVMRYAKKIKANPELSPMYDLDQAEAVHWDDVSSLPQYTGKHNLVGLVLLAGFGMLIYGVFKLGWYIDELAGIFLAMGLLAGVLGGLTPNAIARSFVEGLRMIAFGALIVGVARGILVVLTDGQIIDTIIYSLAHWVQGLPETISAGGMYLVQVVINTFIPSGSGQAAVTIPIMAPVGDLVGISRQIVVLAYQFGDGFTNSIIPTSGVLFASLAMAKIPYERWVKFLWPLMTLWILCGFAAVTLAVFMGYA